MPPLSGLMIPQPPAFETRPPQLFTSWQSDKGADASDDTLSFAELKRVLRRPPLLEQLRREVRLASLPGLASWQGQAGGRVLA